VKIYCLASGHELASMALLKQGLLRHHLRGVDREPPSPPAPCGAKETPRLETAS
jgi:hypothetical protein